MSLIRRRSQLVVYIIVLMFAYFGGPTAHAQNEPLPETAYWTLVANTIDALENERDLAPLASQFADIEQLLLADGTLITVDTGYWVSTLQNDSLSADQQLAQFKALQATETLSAPTVGGATALAELDTILGKQKHQYVNAFPAWMMRMFELLERTLAYLFSLIQTGAENGTMSVIGWVVTGLAVVGLGFFLWYWLRGVRHQFSTESELEIEQADGSLISADVAFEQAQTLADQSDYRQAVRYLYLSALLSLDERGLLRYDRSKTNREYLRSVRGSEFSATLQSVIDVFDRVWYGFQPIDAATYERYAVAVRQLRKA